MIECSDVTLFVRLGRVMPQHIRALPGLGLSILIWSSIIASVMG